MIGSVPQQYCLSGLIIARGTSGAEQLGEIMVGGTGGRGGRVNGC